ncbi:class I SAM-dependent methyltransferase [Prochlorococcus marinus]|uniref:class I SAM-dependent methyltransferase n=1 Tax=Prochlorococcus marinus TaxID=1219 RepID=UPI0022B5CD72|nr:class I SAM-dependent methyltransferase [Prochlorococcus marinus]
MPDIKSLSADYFDSTSDEYTNDYYLSQQDHPKWARQKEIVFLITKYLQSQNTKILDIGCGPGLLEEDLSNLSYKGIGMDISQQMIKISQNRAKAKGFDESWEFMLGDCEDTKLQTQSFDCVIASGVIEYMPEDNKLLKEINRVLKVDGLFILNVTNAFGISTVLNRLSHYVKGIPGVMKLANFVKVSLLGSKTKAKRLTFIPRKHIPGNFLRTASRHGFDLVDDIYQGFTLLPAPFDQLLLKLIGKKSVSLEKLNDTRFRVFGASYLVCLRKKT